MNKLLRQCNSLPVPKEEEEKPLKKKENAKPLSQEEIDDVANKFISDRTIEVARYPLYGLLLLELEAIVVGMDSTIPIAAVNYRNLFLQGAKNSPKTAPVLPYSGFNIAGRRAILVHELLHLVLEHLSIPNQFDHNIANIAQDTVINRIIMSDHNLDFTQLPEGVVTPTNFKGTSGIFIGKGIKREFIPIPDVFNKDWLPIYKDIVSHIEKQCGSKDRDQAIKEFGEFLGKLNPMQGDVEYNKHKDDPDFESDVLKFRQKFISAIEREKTQGTVPAELDRLAQELQTGKVKWTEHLRRLIRTEVSREDFSWKPNSRRQHVGYFPKIYSERLGDVVLVLDTSGSMSESDLSEGLSEFATLRSTESFKLHFISCDAKAYDMISFSPDEEPDWKALPLHGGGGSDARPAFELVEQKMKNGEMNPVLLVYFTDTFLTFPKDPPEYQTIWVTNYPNTSVPWGTLINTNE